jgi:hypothetical protein
MSLGRLIEKRLSPWYVVDTRRRGNCRFDPIKPRLLKGNFAITESKRKLILLSSRFKNILKKFGGELKIPFIRPELQGGRERYVYKRSKNA